MLSDLMRAEESEPPEAAAVDRSIEPHLTAALMVALGEAPAPVKQRIERYLDRVLEGKLREMEGMQAPCPALED
jgi:hypothetical protein